MNVLTWAGDTLSEVSHWLDCAGHGCTRLPFGLTVYSDRAWFERVGTLLIGAGVPRERIGTKIREAMGETSDEPGLRAVP